MISKTIGFRGTLFLDTPIYANPHLEVSGSWGAPFHKIPPRCQVKVSRSCQRSCRTPKHPPTHIHTLPFGIAEKKHRISIWVCLKMVSTPTPNG